MQQDRAIRRIARFSDPATWHVNLQSRYREIMLARFRRVVTFAPQEKPRRGVVRARDQGGVA